MSDEAVKAAAEALRDEWPLMLWSDRDAGAADRAALYAARVAVEAARPHIEAQIDHDCRKSHQWVANEIAEQRDEARAQVAALQAENERLRGKLAHRERALAERLSEVDKALARERYHRERADRAYRLAHEMARERDEARAVSDRLDRDRQEWEATAEAALQELDEAQVAALRANNKHHRNTLTAIARPDDAGHGRHSVGGCDVCLARAALDDSGERGEG